MSELRVYNMLFVIASVSTQKEGLCVVTMIRREQ